MNSVKCVLVGSLLLLAGVLCAAEGKATTDARKLIGTWIYVKGDSPAAPPAGTNIKLEFTKDGKVSLAIDSADQKFKTSGTYTVKGDQLTWSMKAPSGNERRETKTISKLTDKQLILADKSEIITPKSPKPTIVIEKMEFKK